MWVQLEPTWCSKIWKWSSSPHYQLPLVTHDVWLLSWVMIIHKNILWLKAQITRTIKVKDKVWFVKKETKAVCTQQDTTIHAIPLLPCVCMRAAMYWCYNLLMSFYKMPVRGHCAIRGISYNLQDQDASKIWLNLIHISEVQYN